MSKIAWRKAPETFHLGCLLPSYQPSAKTQSTANHLRGWCCWNYHRSSAAPAMLSKNLSHAILKDDLLVICPTVCHRFCIFQVLWMGPSTAITGHDLPALAPPQRRRCPDGWRSNIEREWNGLISCIYKSWWNFSSSQNRNNTIISILNLPESPSTTMIFIHYHHQLNCSTDNSLNFLTKSTGEHLGLEVHHILHLAAINSIRILERKVGSRSNTPPLTPLHHSSGSL